MSAIGILSVLVVLAVAALTVRGTGRRVRNAVLCRDRAALVSYNSGIQDAATGAAHGGGADMRTWRKSTLAALVAALIVVGGFPLIPARPASAADPLPPVLDQDEIQLLSEPALPAWVTFAADRTLFTGETLEGVIADEFGHGPRFDADRFSMVEQYRSPVADADHAVLGDVDGTSQASGEMDAAVVSGSTLRVLGPQGHGYPQRATATLPAGHGTVVGVAIVPSGTGTDQKIVVLTTSGLYRYTISDTTLTHEAGSPTTADIGPLAPSTPSPGVPPALPLSSLLDAYQRPTWDHYGTERDLPVGMVAVVGRATSANAVEARVLQWSPSANNFVYNSAAAIGSVDLGATPAASVTDAQIRFDQDHEVVNSDGGQVTYPMAVLHTVAGQPAAKLTILGDFTARTSDVCPSQEATPTRDLAFEALDLEVKGDDGGKQGQYAAACAVRTRSGASGAFDRVHLDVHGVYILQEGDSDQDEKEFFTSNSEIIPLNRALGVPAVQLTFPCAGWLRLQDTLAGQSFRCNSGNNGKTLFHDPGSVAAHVVVNSAQGEMVVANRSWGVPSFCHQADHVVPPCPPQDQPDLLAANHRVAMTGLPTDGRRPILLTLNPEAWKVKVRVDNRVGRLRELEDPTPVALLVAPPTVRGAQQDVSNPEFASTRGSGEENAVSSSTSLGFTVGLDWEDPSGAFAVGAEFGMDFAMSEGSSSSKNIDITEFYEGAVDDHTLVYRTQTARELTGRVVESTTGVSYTGTERSIPVMIPEGAVTTARTLSSFEQQFPDAYARFGADLAAAAPAETGNPGLYIPPTGISDYCIGEIDEEDDGVDETLETPDLPDNPFADDPTNPSGPDILVGDHRLVTAGDSESVITGSGFDISTEQAESRASEVSLSASVNATVGYVSLGFNFSQSWGAETTATLNQGVSFSAGVGSLPKEILEGETYGWKAFLCKRDIGGAEGELPVWVLNYAVDSYEGIGGLEDMEDIALTEPIQSVRTTRTPSLEWAQPSGTVDSYDLELEAVGANDVHTAPGLATAANLAEATDRDVVTVDWQEVLDAQPAAQRDELLPNQLYRWRITGEDYFGNETVSPYEFFVTDGPPQGVTLSVQPANPDVADPIEVTVNHVHVTNVTYSYECDFGDGNVTPGTTGTISHTYAFPGIYQLTCSVTNGAGESTEVTQVIPVGPNANDDAYDAVEDTKLVVPAEDGVLANDDGAEAATIGVRPTQGSVFLRSDGSFDYTPNANFCGTDTFSYGARGGASVRPAAVTITVACVNDAPQAVSSTPIRLEATEDTTFTMAAPGLRVHFKDVDNVPPALAYTNVNVRKVTSATQPAHGTLTLSSSGPDSGALTYVPDENFCDASDGDFFDVEAVDQAGAVSAAKRVFVDVECVPDPPTAVADPALLLDEDGSVTLRPTDNDTDPDTPVANLRPVITTASAHGASVTVAPDGTVTYEPAANYCLDDRFGYKAFDGEVESANEVIIEVMVACINDAPDARDGEAVVVEDTAGGVVVDLQSLADDPENQLDVDITVVNPPHNGTFVPNGTGAWIYTPAHDFCGVNTVTYMASDGELADLGTVTITVTCVNDAPVARPDTVTVAEDGTVTVDPLANDDDVDGPPISFVLETPPASGTLTPGTDGTHTYEPNENFCGTDSFTYAVTDGTLESAATTVTVTVSCVNDPPVPKPDPPVTVDEDGAVTSDPTGNDVDVEGQPLVPVITSEPDDGTVVVNGDGEIVYTPDPNFCGTDSYGYKVTDGETESPEVVVTVTIACINDAPVATDDAPVAGGNVYRMNQGGPPLTVTAPGVLSNDTDVDGDPLTASVVTGPSNGTLTLKPNGSFTYTPNPGFYGLDSFTYQVSDGNGGTDTGVVTIRVRGITKMAAEPVVLRFSPTAKVYLGTFQARLTDNAGVPVAGKTISFRFGTTPACTGVTNSDGVATCSASVLNLVLAMLNPPQAVFVADDTMLGSSAKSSLLLL